MTITTITITIPAQTVYSLQHLSVYRSICLCAVGKGVNIWDKWTHEGGHVVKNENGDVACDSYHLYQQDIKLLKQMGVG